MSTSSERSPEEKEQMREFLSRKAEIPSALFSDISLSELDIQKREQLLLQREQVLNERERLLSEREQLLNRREQLLGAANHLLSNQDQLDQEARAFYRSQNI